MPDIYPQPGPQFNFLTSLADIAIYGGSAGGGKTFALLLEASRHVSNPRYAAVVFRRTMPMIENPGGLWDEASALYPAMGGVPRISDHEFRFQGGGKVVFAHLQYEDTVQDYQGSQIPLICFDEFCHFSEAMFFYMLSRNRSTCGVSPYIRATCNPDADSWVADFISWWIDQVTGLPIPERAGKLRWFVRINEKLIWADDAAELRARFPETRPKSLTFIPAKLTDNKKLMDADPGYLGNLMALPLVERERLLGGNWKIRPAAGLYFQRTWCPTVSAIPVGTRFVRGWDLAATPKTDMNDPDWTVGVLMGRSPDGQFILADHVRLRGTPSDVDRLIRNVAAQDKERYGHAVSISLPQDPNQAGKAQAMAHVKMLAGYRVSSTVESRRPSGVPTETQMPIKVYRFAPFSSQAEAGNVAFYVPPDGSGENWDWKGLANELEAFPQAKHDDDADATSRAFAGLLAKPEPSKSVRINFMAR